MILKTQKITEVYTVTGLHSKIKYIFCKIIFQLYFTGTVTGYTFLLKNTLRDN